MDAQKTASKRRAYSKRPAASVDVVDDVFHQSMLEAAYDAFSQITIPEGVLFVSPSREGGGLIVSDLVEQVFPAPILSFILATLRSVVAKAPEGSICTGGAFEVWLGKTIRPGRGAFLHVDNDESRRRRTGKVVCPKFGVILHIGPQGLRGGETMFETDSRPLPPSVPLFENHPWRQLASTLRAPKIVTQKPGRLILFDGDLPHAVAPIAEATASPRVALLANFWAQPPMAATNGRLTAEKLKALVFS